MADDVSPDDTPLRSGASDRADLPAAVVAAVPGLNAFLDAVGSLSTSDLDGRQAEAVATLMARVASRASVAQGRMLPVIEADGLWSIKARSLPQYAAREFGTSVRTAQAQVRLGRALRDDLPVTAVAAASGEIGVEHAHVLASVAPTSDARRTELASDRPCNEAWLVEQARQMTVEQFRRCVRSWARAVDPDADDRGYVEACDRAFLEVSPTMGGYHVNGFLTVDDGQTLRTVLEALTPVPAAGDDRTADQRRATALGALARVGLNAAETGKGRTVVPGLHVLVTYDALQDLAAPSRAAEEGSSLQVTPEKVAQVPQFEDGTPIPRALLDRLACDSELNRYLFGPRSEILDVGRAERTFTKARRNAIIARDRHCRFPGCSAPPLIAECHHVKHWARDHGSTSVDNGILLCFHHHTVVHTRGFEIHRREDRWVFTDAAGRELADAYPDDDGAA